MTARAAGVLRARVVGGPGGSARVFKAVVQFLGKIGPDLLIEAFPDRVTLRALNAAQSAYAAATLPAPFFAGYEVFNEAVVRAAVPAKHVLAALRGGRADAVALEVAPAVAEATVTVTSDTGLTKRFRLAPVDAEMLNAEVDEAGLAAGFVAPPGELGTLLASLGGGAHAALGVGPPPAHPGAGHAVVELASWTGPGGGGGGGGGRGAAASARLQLGAGSASLRAVRSPPGGARVTLSSRDLRALLPLCDALNADVEVAFGRPGGPVRAAPAPREGGGGGFGGDGTTPDVILVLATQEEEGGGDGGREAAPTAAAAAPPPAAAAPDPYAFQGTPVVPPPAAASVVVASSAADDGDDDLVDDGDGDGDDDDGEGVAATPPDQMPTE